MSFIANLIINSVIMAVLTVAIITVGLVRPARPRRSVEDSGPTVVTHCRRYALKLPGLGVLGRHRVTAGPCSGRTITVWCRWADLYDVAAASHTNRTIDRWMADRGISEWRWAL